MKTTLKYKLHIFLPESLLILSLHFQKALVSLAVSKHNKHRLKKHVLTDLAQLKWTVTDFALHQTSHKGLLHRHAIVSPSCALSPLTSPWLTFKLFAYIEEGKSLSSDGKSQPTHWERLHFYEDSKWYFIALMHECG